MAVEIFLRHISPTKLALAILFFCLGIGEFMDGIFDVGDFAVPALLLLSVNDLFLNYKSRKFKSNDVAVYPTGDEIINYTEFQKDVFRSLDNKTLTKVVMNIIFLVMFIGPVILEIMGINFAMRAEFYRYAFIVWAGIFLMVSLLRLKRTMSLSSIIFSNVALVLLVGAFII